MMHHHPLWIWGIVALAGIAVLTFGVLSWGTNLFTAVGIGLMAVGAAKIFAPGGPPMVGIGLLIGGAALWLGHDMLPDLSIADAASFAGVNV